VTPEIHFANQLRKHRKAHNLTQADLTRLLAGLGYPVGQATISKLENGQVSISLTLATRIAEALNVPLDYLTRQAELR
jgi:transcriptional regulator with XRE-family HTH domain